MKLRLSSAYPPAMINPVELNGVRTTLSRQTEIAIVSAIKAVRTLSRIGLAEAKNLIEELADKGEEYSKDLIVAQSVTDFELDQAIAQLKAAGIKVVETSRGERELFRVSLRKMIGVALDDDQIDLAKDLFTLYEKHFAR